MNFQNPKVKKTARIFQNIIPKNGVYAHQFWTDYQFIEKSRLAFLDYLKDTQCVSRLLFCLVYHHSQTKTTKIKIVQNNKNENFR